MQIVLMTMTTTIMMRQLDLLCQVDFAPSPHLHQHYPVTVTPW